MDRAVFMRRFVEAAVVARDCARQFVEEPLPDAMRFRVHLNGSYDGHASPDFKLFPKDSSREVAPTPLDVERVVELLWRDGYVPQWVNLTVVGETGDASVLDVVACGRFTDEERRLYYVWTDYAPFGPKGPDLPVGYVEGTRFSIYERSSCFSTDDLERAGRNAEKVWSLDLRGPTFDDTTLVAGPTFARLEILEMRGARIRGPGLAGLRRFPRLRHLRVSLGAVRELSFSDLPELATLETLALRSLPPRLEAVSKLAAAVPNLRELTLGSTVATHADDTLALEKLEELTLECPAPPPWVGMPKSLRRLTITARKASDDDVLRLLAACPETLDSLGLRGTRVSDAIIDALERLPAVRYVDAVATRITKARLERFAASRPGFKCWPTLESDPVPTVSFERGTGSILDANVDALVNPVNCVGVMGKGLALAFKKAFPQVFEEYERACRAGEVVLGRVHVVETRAERGPKYLIHFPTKRDWRDESRLEDIKTGLVDLAAQVAARGISSVAIPALGCGLGGLDWRDVRPLTLNTLAAHLEVHRDLRIVLFEPQ